VRVIVFNALVALSLSSINSVRADLVRAVTFKTEAHRSSTTEIPARDLGKALIVELLK
jgi:hypothetical protein